VLYVILTTSALTVVTELCESDETAKPKQKAEPTNKTVCGPTDSGHGKAITLERSELWGGLPGIKFRALIVVFVSELGSTSLALSPHL
jgi:hypothetical protein